MFIYFREKERGEPQHKQGTGRDRDTQNLKQALGSKLSAQSLMRSSNTWTVPELKSDAYPYTYFIHPPTHLSPSNHQFVLQVRNLVFLSLFSWFICFVFQITHEWNNMVFIFLWLCSPSNILSRSIHVVANARSYSFIWLSNTSLYIYIPHFLYPFIHWWGTWVASIIWLL